MRELKNIRLVLHLSPRGVAWAIARRSSAGDRTFDSRIDSGYCRALQDGDSPEAALKACHEALQAAFRSRGIPWPEASREPLGAVGGGRAAARQHLEELSGVSIGGHPIDTALPAI